MRTEWNIHRFQQIRTMLSQYHTHSAVNVDGHSRHPRRVSEPCLQSPFNSTQYSRLPAFWLTGLIVISLCRVAAKWECPSCRELEKLRRASGSLPTTDRAVHSIRLFWDALESAHSVLTSSSQTRIRIRRLTNARTTVFKFLSKQHVEQRYIANVRTFLHLVSHHLGTENPCIRSVTAGVNFP